MQQRSGITLQVHGVGITLLCAGAVCAKSHSNPVLHEKVQTMCVCILHVELARVWAGEPECQIIQAPTSNFRLTKRPVSKLSALLTGLANKKELAASQGCQTHALLACPTRAAWQ